MEVPVSKEVKDEAPNSVTIPVVAQFSSRISSIPTPVPVPASSQTEEAIQQSTSNGSIPWRISDKKLRLVHHSIQQLLSSPAGADKLESQEGEAYAKYMEMFDGKVVGAELENVDKPLTQSDGHTSGEI